MSLVFSPLHFAAAVRASTAPGSALAQWPRVLNLLTKATRTPTKDEAEEIQEFHWLALNATPVRREPWEIQIARLTSLLQRRHNPHCHPSWTKDESTSAAANPLYSDGLGSRVVPIWL
jgi:hypothetical protein